MAHRRVSFAEGEWYHCYSRTIDYSRPFTILDTTERFLELLYIANQRELTPHLSDLRDSRAHAEMFSIARAPALVRIGAYCMMPTHYHLLLQPVVEDGISRFMHRVGTGITRFHNDAQRRIGNLFVNPFRSKHVHDDRYFKRVVHYIHLNPLDLYEPHWKQGRMHHQKASINKLGEYKLSSLPEYLGTQRSQGAILDRESFELLREGAAPLGSLVMEAAEYYQFLELDVPTIMPQTKTA